VIGKRGGIKREAKSFNEIPVSFSHKRQGDGKSPGGDNPLFFQAGKELGESSSQQTNVMRKKGRQDGKPAVGGGGDGKREK